MSKDQRILLFSSQSSPRFTYILHLFFERLLNINVETTDSVQIFKQSPLPKINYSTVSFHEKCLTIPPHSLLFEKNVKKCTLAFDSVIVVKEEDEQIILPFDVLAAAFYLVSRYEEYLPFEADEHGRFSASQSVAYQQQFLERPLVNLWALEVKRLLFILFPDLKTSSPTYKPLLTYDIDIAWAYLGRSVYRTIGGTVRDLTSNLLTFKNRIEVYLKKEKDPFDTFKYIFDQHKEHKLPAQFFFLLGEHGAYDKNINPRSTALHQLIAQVQKEYPVGIHPSYASNTSNQQLASEHQLLCNITHQSIDKSRQHYLKLRFPETYRHLIAIGIRADYSMGYADAIGFRASIATPFFWFDLKRNEATDLMLFPFQVMDVTLKNYLRLNPAEASLVIKKMILTCKEVGGCFSSIWHNSSLSKLNEWDLWLPVYEQMLKDAKP